MVLQVVIHRLFAVADSKGHIQSSWCQHHTLAVGCMYALILAIIMAYTRLQYVNNTPGEQKEIFMWCTFAA